MVIWIRIINELNKEGALMVESIGKRLKKLRIENGYTQNQIAEYLELKQNDISKLEHNMKKLKGNHMLKLSNLYGCPMEYIALGIDKYYNNLKFHSNKSKLSLNDIADLNRIISNLEFLSRITNK